MLPQVRLDNFFDAAVILPLLTQIPVSTGYHKSFLNSRSDAVKY